MTFKVNRTQASEEARKKRVEELRDKTGLKLSTLNISNIEPQSISGHIENFVGTVAIPLGIAGPLKIEMKTGETEEIFAPMATTEGALISSITRGAIAINLSGGVQTRVISNKMVRAPQFDFDSLDQALQFKDWLSNQEEILKKLVKQKSSYAELNEIQIYNFGRSIHVRFIYSTGNAAGQNMTTFCTSYICQWILQNFEADTQISCSQFLIEGNLSSDKKNSFINQSQGRGRTVVAEALIKKQVLKKIMKLDVTHFVQVFNRSKSARIYSGLTGYNINVANVVAAVFAATGQDFACIHESSVAELHVEQKGEDLLMTMVMPTLVVGTVGGGTQLPHARENLAIMNCLTTDGADRLAQIIAGYALALDLSTSCAVGSGDFVSAHQKLARQLDQKLFKLSEVTPAFFIENFEYFKNTTVLNLKKVLADNKEGHTIDLANHYSKKICGLMAYEVTTETEHLKAFVKIKPKDTEIVKGASQLLNYVSPTLAAILNQNIQYLPFQNCHLREIEAVSLMKNLLPNNSPELLGSLINNDKDIYIIAQKYLENANLISHVIDTNPWTHDRKQNALQTLMKVHIHFWNRKAAAFGSVPHLLSAFEYKKDENQFWQKWTELSYRFLQPYPKLFNYYNNCLENFESDLKKLSDLPQTLLHYDFNSRNLAFAANTEKEQVIVFDWEMASWGPAQRDLVEFILFTSNPDHIAQDFEQTIQHYRLNLQDHLGIQLDSEIWQRGARICLNEFLVRRMPFYYVLSEIGQCHYIDRLLKNLDVLISLDEK